MDSTIADDLSLSGKTSLYLRAARGGERVVHLELSRNLAVSQIVGEDGQAVTFFQNQDLTPHEATRRGNDAIVVVLPAAKKVGDEFRLEVGYRGNVISNAGNGVEFVGERGTWFAHVGGEHFASFDLNFRWPKRLTLVATGAKVETHDDTEPKSGRWRSETPFATAGFNLGEYRVASTGEAPRVHIYANKELEDEITKRLLERSGTQLDNTISFAHPLSGTVSSVVAAPPPPSPSAALNELGKQVLDSIHYFGQLNGPFPFDNLDIARFPDRWTRLAGFDLPFDAGVPARHHPGAGRDQRVGAARVAQRDAVPRSGAPVVGQSNGRGELPRYLDRRRPGELSGLTLFREQKTGGTSLDRVAGTLPGRPAGQTAGADGIDRNHRTDRTTDAGGATGDAQGSRSVRDDHVWQGNLGVSYAARIDARVRVETIRTRNSENCCGPS